MVFPLDGNPSFGVFVLGMHYHHLICCGLFVSKQKVEFCFGVVLKNLRIKRIKRKGQGRRYADRKHEDRRSSPVREKKKNDI